MNYTELISSDLIAVKAKSNKALKMVRERKIKVSSQFDELKFKAYQNILSNKKGFRLKNAYNMLEYVRKIIQTDVEDKTERPSSFWKKFNSHKSVERKFGSLYRSSNSILSQSTLRNSSALCRSNVSPRFK